MTFTEFLSTLPARGATHDSRRDAHGGDISIHAPREGSDTFALEISPLLENFYPRSPRGERQQMC